MYYPISATIIVGGKSWITKQKVELVPIVLDVKIMLEIMRKTLVELAIQIQTQIAKKRDNCVLF